MGIHEPVLLLYTLEYFVEGHRFNILEDIGCYPATTITPLAFILLCWPLAIAVVSAVYDCKFVTSNYLVPQIESALRLPGLIIRACAKHYHTICNNLMSSSQHVNLGHY